MEDLEQTDVNITLVKDILYTLVKTVGSGDTPNPNSEHKLVTSPELQGNRKRKLEKVGKKEKKKKKNGPSEMVKLRRKYAAKRMSKPKTWDEAKAKYRREASDPFWSDPPAEHVHVSTQANYPREMINFQLQALRSMTEQDKTYNRRSMSKAVRELSVYVTNRDYSDSVKKAVKILEFRMLLDEFDPPCGGLIPLLVPEVPEEILSRIIDRLMTVSEPGKKYDTSSMVFAMKKLSTFIKDCDRFESVEMVMKVMLRIYKNVTRKLSELGNPDLRICLDKKYKRTLESLSKCGHKGCTWYKEFCTFLGSDEVKNDLAVNEANKRCLLK